MSGYVIFWISFMAIMPYIYIRMFWVFRKRMDLLHSDFGKFKMIKSSEYMIFKRFFCWDFDKLIND